MKKPTRRQIIIATVILVLIVPIVAARLYMDTWLTNYVNRVLGNMNGYRGEVANIDIDLYRGAYRIEKLVIKKTSGRFPAPFVDAEVIDLSIQWKALFHGRVVSDIHIERGTLNFARDASGRVTQTGKEVDWSQKAKDLMPIDINEVTISNSKIAYRDFSEEPQVNLYVTELEGRIENLRNVVDINNSLPAPVEVRGNSIGGGKFFLKGHANILKPQTDFNIDTKLEGVNLPALNNYLRAYAAIDVEKGSLSVFSEMQVRNGVLSGYVKPIANNIQLINLRADAKSPIKLLWESIVSIFLETFENQRKDQFATVIPVSGNLKEVHTGFWATIGGILRNAFVKAFEKNFSPENEQS